MRKFILLFLIILLISFISAVEIDIKDSYNSGETMIVKISGSFTDSINEDNIFFYEDHVRVPIEYDILKLEEDYYLYALLPQAEKNYTLSLEDIKYYQGAKISEEDIKSNFSTTSELADFSINPGVISTSEVFSITIQNLQNSKRTIKIEYNEKETAFSLRSGEKKTINFNVENVYKDNLKFIVLSSDKTSYEIPIYLFSNSEQTLVGKKGLKFEIVNSETTISTNSEKKKIIYLKNTGDEDLKDISISLTPELESYMNLSLETISELKKNSSEKIELLIQSESNQDYIIGEIIAEVDGETYASGALYLNIISDYVPIDDEDPEGEIIIPKTCEELGGSVCDINLEICNGEEVDSFEGNCCLSKICNKKNSSSLGMMIGWGIVILVVLFLVWFFFKKYLKASGPLTILDKLKKK